MPGVVIGKYRIGTVMRTVYARALVFLLGSVCFGVSFTDVSQAATQDVEYELQVKPRVCITLDSNSACAMQLIVSWSAPVSMDICLKLEDDDAMLGCWKQQREGEFELELSRMNNAVVQLLDPVSNVVLNEAEVTIVSRDLRDSRRRRRHVWSII